MTGIRRTTSWIALALFLVACSHAAESPAPLTTPRQGVDLPPPVPSIADKDFWVHRFWLDDHASKTYEVYDPAIFFGLANIEGRGSIEYEMQGAGKVYRWGDDRWESVTLAGSFDQLTNIYLGVVPSPSAVISVLFQVVPSAPAASRETTPADLVPNPTPPYHWDLFSPWPVTGGPPPLAPPSNTLFAIGPAVGCGTRVVIPSGITAKLSGTASGGLSYNDRQRGNGKYPSVNGGNKNLGGFRDTIKTDVFNLTRSGYKYEASVTFQGPLKDAFYGQLISGPHSLDPSKPVHASFREDGPANDWVTKKWNLQPGETKASYPTVEVVGQTVRWIDAPGGSPNRVQGTYHIVILYAGACGAVEDVEILLVKYPAPAPKGANKAGVGEAFTVTQTALDNLTDTITFE